MQIAAVVKHVRTHFGNNYRDRVDAETVKAREGSVKVDWTITDIVATDGAVKTVCAKVTTHGRTFPLLRGMRHRYQEATVR